MGNKTVMWVALLLTLAAKPYAQGCNTYFTGQFVPAQQVADDSVYYMFDFSSVYELHSTKEYRNIYRLNWFGYCSFEMVFDESSYPGDSPYPKDKIWKCTATFTNDSSLELHMGNNVKSLNMYKGVNVWHLMTQRDHELRKAEAERKKSMDEYEALMAKGDSLTGFLSLMKGLMHSFDNGFSPGKEELEAIRQVFGVLATFDATQLHAISSHKYRESVDAEVTAQYMYYFKKIFGRWEYFSVFKQPLISGITEANEQAGTTKYGFKVKFANCKGELLLDLALSNENDTRTPVEGEEHTYIVTQGAKMVHSININTPEYEPSAFLDSLAAPFFKNFYKKKYAAIYKESDAAFKQVTSQEQAENLFAVANSMREGNDYRFYRHGFSMKPELGGLMIMYYTAETARRTVYLTLIYTAVPNASRLAGINIEEKLKK